MIEPAACANWSGSVKKMFGFGLGGLGDETESTVLVSSVGRPGSNVTFSSGVNRLRFADRTPVAPAADATETVVCSSPPNRSAPVSNEYAMTPRLYQCSSALLPAAE